MAQVAALYDGIGIDSDGFMSVLEYASIRTGISSKGKGRARGDRDDVAGNGVAGNGADPLDPWTLQMSKT
eukprot:9665822-Heterocapsa_arctica.AAC.1